MAVTRDSISDADLADLVQRLKEATSAFINGDMERYLTLTPHAPGYTLMNPFGGEPVRYQERRESLMAAASFFRGGEAWVDVVDVQASGDLLVLVMIERQHGEVGGLPDQDWSLRVTQVYRRDADVWRLIHRHADPLVRSIGLERAAEIARG